MNQCLKCSSPLFGDVKFCPFCGQGTGPASQRAAPAETAATVTPAPAAAPTATIASAPVAPTVPPTPAPVPAAPMPAAPVPAAPAAVRAKRAKSAPTPAPVAQPAASPAPHVPEPVPPKKGGSGKWIVGGIVLVLVLLYNVGKQDTSQVDCDTAFDLGTKAVASGDLAAAREQALRASAVCVDRARSKADALQAAITQAETTGNACLRSFRSIESMIQDHRLGSARENLNQLTTACSANAAATELRNQLGEAQAAAQAAQGELRNALEAGDVALAKTAFAKLAGINREDPDLPQLKAEVDTLVAAAEAAAAAAATAAAEPVQPAEEGAPLAAPQQRPADNREAASMRNTDPNAAQKSSMASMFLRDAEQALAQRKFDSAKTYVESARRIDPDNPRLETLMQQIRERERQVLQQEPSFDNPVTPKNKHENPIEKSPRNNARNQPGGWLRHPWPRRHGPGVQPG